MELFSQRVGQLRNEDIRRVVETHASESRTLDFKRAWPSTNDGGKALKDLALDLVAMANTAGGVILVGVQERADAGAGDSAAADALSGCGPSFDFDVAMPQLQGILRTLVEPALVGLVVPQYLRIDGVPGGILALGVPSSPVRPHLMRDPFRILRRAARGRVDPDIAELRQMFSEHAAWRDRGEQLLHQEIARAQGNTALLAAGGPTLFLDLVPVDPYSHRLTMRDHFDSLAARLLPFGSSARDSDLSGWGGLRFTATGVRRESTRTVAMQPTMPWACAVERDGTLREWRNIGWSDDFAKRQRGPEASGFLDDHLLGWALISHIRNRCAMLRELLHVEGPMLLLLAWLFVNGQAVAHNRKGRILVSGGSYGEILTAPIELLNGDAAIDLESIRRSVETFWNAAGFPGLETTRIPEDLREAGIPYVAQDWAILATP